MAVREATRAWEGEMRVQVQEVMHYPPGGVSASGSGWDAVEHRHPGWASIESAIRRLDRDEYPFVWLHSAEPVEGETPENALCIMGGRGEYSLLLSRSGRDFYYHDESRGEGLVRIWESDQGSVQREKDLCNDLPKVLVVAKHFFESGEPLPGLFG